jgi:hypothetical protein
MSKTSTAIEKVTSKEAVLAPASKERLAIIAATRPEQTMLMEDVTLAYAQLAEERGMYDVANEKWREYLLARRRTVELIRPTIKMGGRNRFTAAEKVEGNQAVTLYSLTLADYGLTQMQWSRRLTEYRVPEDLANVYLDNCARLGVAATPTGIIAFAELFTKTDKPKPAPKRVIPFQAAMDILNKLLDLLDAALTVTDPTNVQTKKDVLTWAKTFQAKYVLVGKAWDRLIEKLERSLK